VGRFGLGDNGGAALDAPAEDDLRWGRAMPCGDRGDGLVGAQYSSADGGICGEEDAFGFAEREELVLGEERVKLDLVYGWDDVRFVQEVGQSFDAEVRDADTARLACGVG
jgi:hypothetical protein